MKVVSEAEVDRWVQSAGPSGYAQLAARFGTSFAMGEKLVTADAALATRLLMNRPDTVHRHESYRAAIKLVPGAPGILFFEGETWEARLRALMPAFRRQSVDAGTALIATAVGEVVAGLAPGSGDLFADVTAAGLRAVLRGGYGLDPDHLAVRRFGEHLVAYKATTMSPTPRYRFDHIVVNRHLAGVPFALARLLLLRSRMAKLEHEVAQISADEAAVADRGGWFGRLVAAGLAGRELTDELNHLYGAFTAADYTVTQALLALARDGRLASAVLAELDAVRGARASLALADLDDLPTTRGFLLEILRLYPVSLASWRQTGEPLEVEGRTFPAGTEVLLLLGALHRDPALWEDPDALRPERWNGRDPDARDSGWIPFLRGPRKCIGRDLAELHILLVLHAFLGRFTLDVASPVPSVPPFMIPRFAGPVTWRRAVRAPAPRAST